MSRDKQIEEMASVICKASSNRGECQKCGFFKYKSCFKFEDANNLYNAGYRKASDVAEQIFVKIAKLIHRYLNDGDYSFGEFALDVADLEQQYESEGKGR